jgi:hypothetical protein
LPADDINGVAINGKCATHSLHILACLVIRVKKPLSDVWFEEGAQVEVNVTPVVHQSDESIKDGDNI